MRQGAACASGMPVHNQIRATNTTGMTFMANLVAWACTQFRMSLTPNTSAGPALCYFAVVPNRTRQQLLRSLPNDINCLPARWTNSQSEPFSSDSDSAFQISAVPIGEGTA